MIRVVLDTCVIVAALRSRRGASFVLVDLATQHNSFFQPILTEALASQYEDVVSRPQHRLAGEQQVDLGAFVDALLVPAHWASTNFSYRPLLEDAGDELVLEAAINGEAEYLITFNVKHFRPASRYGIQVIQPGNFLEILKQRGFTYGKE